MTVYHARQKISAPTVGPFFSGEKDPNKEAHCTPETLVERTWSHPAYSPPARGRQDEPPHHSLAGAGRGRPGASELAMGVGFRVSNRGTPHSLYSKTK